MHSEQLETLRDPTGGTQPGVPAAPPDTHRSRDAHRAGQDGPNPPGIKPGGPTPSLNRIWGFLPRILAWDVAGAGSHGGTPAEPRGWDPQPGSAAGVGSSPLPLRRN